MNNDKYMRYFCENIKALRKANRYSKKQMAQKLSLVKREVSSLERGKIPEDLSVDVFVKIYEHFGVKATKMFSPSYLDEE